MSVITFVFCCFPIELGQRILWLRLGWDRPPSHCQSWLQEWPPARAGWRRLPAGGRISRPPPATPQPFCATAHAAREVFSLQMTASLIRSWWSLAAVYRPASGSARLGESWVGLPVWLLSAWPRRWRWVKRDRCSEVLGHCRVRLLMGGGEAHLFSVVPMRRAWRPRVWSRRITSLSAGIWRTQSPAISVASFVPLLPKWGQEVFSYFPIMLKKYKFPSRDCRNYFIVKDILNMSLHSYSYKSCISYAHRTPQPHT